MVVFVDLLLSVRGVLLLLGVRGVLLLLLGVRGVLLLLLGVRGVLLRLVHLCEHLLGLALRVLLLILHLLRALLLLRLLRGQARIALLHRQLARLPGRAQLLHRVGLEVLGVADLEGDETGDELALLHLGGTLLAQLLALGQLLLRLRLRIGELARLVELLELLDRERLEVGRVPLVRLHEVGDELRLLHAADGLGLLLCRSALLHRGVPGVVLLCALHERTELRHDLAERVLLEKLRERRVEAHREEGKGGGKLDESESWKGLERSGRVWKGLEQWYYYNRSY